MANTPIIISGQVYLHVMLNEYVVVTKANRGEITFAGNGIRGMYDADVFVERFAPVNPEDLTPKEHTMLCGFTNMNLTTGWVSCREDDDDEEELEDETDLIYGE